MILLICSYIKGLTKEIGPGKLDVKESGGLEVEKYIGDE